MEVNEGFDRKLIRKLPITKDVDKQISEFSYHCYSTTLLQSFQFVRGFFTLEKIQVT